MHATSLRGLKLILTSSSNNPKYKIIKSSGLTHQAPYLVGVNDHSSPTDSVLSQDLRKSRSNIIRMKNRHCDDRKQSPRTLEIASFHGVTVAAGAGYSNYPDLISYPESATPIFLTHIPQLKFNFLIYQSQNKHGQPNNLGLKSIELVIGITAREKLNVYDIIVM